MRIGELARTCGVNPKTVRYYETVAPKGARGKRSRRERRVISRALTKSPCHAAGDSGGLFGPSAGRSTR